MLEVKKFEADWCGPCKALKPILENVSSKFGNTVNFSYINIDEQFEVAQKYHVRSVPTVIIEKNLFKKMAIFKVIVNPCHKDRSVKLTNSLQ